MTLEICKGESIRLTAYESVVDVVVRIYLGLEVYRYDVSRMHA
jgi:hypothetical protein